MASIERLKVSIPVWESDKDPAGYQKWAETMSGLVRSCEGGPELENYKEEKIGVTQTKQRSIPSFLKNDPDFQASSENVSARPQTQREVVFPQSPGDIGPQGNRPIETPAATHPLSTPRSSTRISSPGASKSESFYQASKVYGDLSDKAKALDGHIFSLMMMYVKGGQLNLLNFVTFPSYVQASILLTKHMAISSNSRKRESLKNMEALDLKNGDIKQWAIDSVERFNEMLDSGVTIQDFGLMCLVGSLDGKSKYVQHQITNDIDECENSSQIVIYDVVQKYASQLSSVNGIKKTNQIEDMEGKPVLSIEDVKCHNCGKLGHFQRECPDKAKEKPGDFGQQHPFPFRCKHCGKKGHKKADCPDKDKPPKKYGKANSVNKDKEDKDSFTSSELAKMLAKLKAGETVGSVTPLTQEEIVDLLHDKNATQEHLLDSSSSSCAVGAYSGRHSCSLTNVEWSSQSSTFSLDAFPVTKLSSHVRVLCGDVVCDAVHAVLPIALHMIGEHDHAATTTQLLASQADEVVTVDAFGLVQVAASVMLLIANEVLCESVDDNVCYVGKLIRKAAQLSIIESNSKVQNLTRIANMVISTRMEQVSVQSKSLHKHALVFPSVSASQAHLVAMLLMDSYEHSDLGMRLYNATVCSILGQQEIADAYVNVPTKPTCICQCICQCMADHDEDGDNGESKYHSRLMGKTEMDVVQYQTSASLLCQIGNHLIGLESDSKTYSNCGYDLCDAAVMSVLPIALHMNSTSHDCNSEVSIAYCTSHDACTEKTQEGEHVNIGDKWFSPTPISNPRVWSSIDEAETFLKQVLKLENDGQRVSMVSAVSDQSTAFVQDGVWCSLCGGLDTLALIAKQLKVVPSRYVSVEISKPARMVSQSANPKSDTFPGIDHGWMHDLLQITSDAVGDLGPVSIVGMGAPCQDHSKCRLLPPRFQSDKMENKRPGFAGEKGKVFKHGVQVILWMLQVNPKLVFMVENVDFRDMKEDCDWVTTQLGVQPIMLDGSLTRRRRLYWTNLNLPNDVAACVSHGDPDACMDAGRTLYKHGPERFVRTICSSWTGDANEPRANTRLPVLVDDVNLEGGRQLRPHEAEKLMGMPADYTKGDGITNIMRLRCIGNAWDVNVVMAILCVYRMQGEFKPLAKGETQTSTLSKKDLLLQKSLIVMQSVMGDANFADVLSQYSKGDQLKFLLLVSKWHDKNPSKLVNACGSILDSGSGRHINNEVEVTDPDDTIPLKGFNNTISWTSGSGSLPLVMDDIISGNKVLMQIDEVDKVIGNTEPILSMGKLIKQGVDFHFTDGGKCCEAISPDGKMKFKVELGNDDVLRLPHDLKHATNETTPHAPKVAMIVNAVSRQKDVATAKFVHELFNHGSEEICYRSLLNTFGYKAIRTFKFHCKSCALANARRRGLSHKPVLVCTPLSVVASLEEADYADEETLTDGDSDGGLADVEFDDTAVVAKHDVKQKSKRFDLENLRPWEVMMADNKEYPCAVRGDYKTAFALIDVKTQRKLIVKLIRKAHNHNALSEILSITGAHKVPYSCTLYTDGCGSMGPVREVALKMGINHEYIPPHTQSLNDSEKVVDRVWAAAKTHMLHTGAPDHIFAECVEMVAYIDQYMATNPARDYLTPLQLQTGVKPSIHHLVPFFTACEVHAPKDKRQKFKSDGDVLSTAESGNVIGFQGPNSKVYKVLLSDNRVVHSIHVTFDFENAPQTEEASKDEIANANMNDGEVELSFGDDSAKEAYEDDGFGDQEYLESYGNDGEPSTSKNDPPKSIPDLSKAAQKTKGSAPWKTFNSPLKPRPRVDMNEMELTRKNEGRANLVAVVNTLADEDVLESVKDAKLCALVEQAQNNKDEALLLEVAHRLAMNVSQTDISWKQTLVGPHRQDAIDAYQKEYDSLTGTVLRRLLPLDSKFDTAKNLATSGRFLLDKKRSGAWKARGVKRGFEENLIETDGPNFNYYAHVAEVKAIRATLLRRRRRGRKLAIKDVTTAFLQSIPYPDGKKKYIKFKNPITGEWMWFEQSGPIYGENSAPSMWGEKTLAPYLTSEEGCKLVRGDNHKGVYYSKQRDLLVLTYVDDFLMDGEEDDILWMDGMIDKKFKSKPLEWVVENVPIDYIGMEILLTKERLFLSMEKYIEKMQVELTALGMKIPNRKVSIPISDSIDGESERLPPKLVRLLLTALGCCGWCVHTTRIDCAYAFSRNGQHTSNPTVSILASVTHMVQYLVQHKNLCLSQKLYPEDIDIGTEANIDDQLGFSFWCDTDHAGNTEIQNKRRSQNAMVACIDFVPFDWSSKASSVTFATPLIGEAHADVSTGSVEIYGAGNATMDILDDCYLIEEMGMEFPIPFILKMDNTTAKAFCDETVKRSKLKHIDCRQEWCKMIRNKNIVIAEYVESEGNLADILTKILEPGIFLYLRDIMMMGYSLPS